MLSVCRSTTSWVCEHWEGLSTSAHSCTSSAKNSAWHREVLKYLWNGKRKPTALFPRKVSTYIYIDILHVFSESLCFYLRLRPSFRSILPTDRPTLIDPNAYFIAILLFGKRPDNKYFGLCGSYRLSGKLLKSVVVAPKGARDNTEMSLCVCVPRKLFLQKLVAALIGPAGHPLPAPDIDYSKQDFKDFFKIHISWSLVTLMRIIPKPFCSSRKLITWVHPAAGVDNPTPCESPRMSLVSLTNGRRVQRVATMTECCVLGRRHPRGAQAMVCLTSLRAVYPLPRNTPSFVGPIQTGQGLVNQGTSPRSANLHF